MAEKVSPTDRLIVQGLSIGSAIAGLMPSVDRPIGNSGSNLQHPVRWRALPVRRMKSQIEWAAFEPSVGSGRVPNNYKGAAKLSVDTEHLVNIKEMLQGVDAVAYRFGTAAVVGYSRDHGNIFTPDEADSERSSIRMRLGSGQLLAAIGVYSPTDKTFLPLHDADTIGDVVPMEQNQERFV